jgi:putative salt-induced outer membrane protein YdiY
MEIRKKVISLCLAAVALSTATHVVAEDEEKAPEWKSSVEFGYVATSGNTETTTINGAFSASYEVEKWRNTLGVTTIFGSAEDASTSEVETNAERYFIEGKTDYKYSESSYAFVLANYDDDRFSGNDYQVSVSGGRGFVIDTGETSKLDIEIGAGYRETKLKATVDLPSESIDETIFRLAGNYVCDITKTSKFEQKISTEIGDDNTVTKSYTGLSANVADNLALKLSLTATHQSDVRGDTEELDTVTAVTIVYNF